VFQLDEAERQLGLVLPSDLRAVLRESNGVEGEYELGLLWPLDRIVEDNFRFRTSEDFKSLYMPFSHLLFIADAGNGDQFAYPIRADGTIRCPDVFVWSHEEDSRTWVAPSLRLYFEWWLSGRIKL
jgi:hypothetical protein